ncbi:MAG: hypothetical protein WD690_19540 [Vicinamibacterales bacterium]
MRWLSLLAAVIVVLFAASAARPQETARLWQDPGPLASRDLFWGNGSQERAPQPPFRFVQENKKGSTPKVVVTDARGATWSVKFSSEAHAEVAAARLMWAFGYPVEEMYYVHTGKIDGARGLARAGDVIEDDGTFWEARFERRDPKFVEGAGWALASNPFAGSKELSGLVILFALINNWDTDLDRNQAVYAVTTAKGVEQWYIADDIGASFGRFDLESPIKWNLAEYRKDKLIASVEPDAIVLNYRAYGTPPTRIPIDHARWFAKMASELTPAQVRRAFEAAGTPPADIDGFVETFMAKLRELQSGLRVRLLVLRNQARRIEMRVALRRAEARVSEHLLNGA